MTSRIFSCTERSPFSRSKVASSLPASAFFCAFAFFLASFAAAFSSFVFDGMTSARSPGRATGAREDDARPALRGVLI